MIGYISGTIQYRGDTSLIIATDHIGYLVHTTNPVIGGSAEGARVSLWTHLVVREDALDLYGFADRRELGLFKQLIGVSGIGPKSALGILNVAPVETLLHAIGNGDISYLTKVSGVGKKSAQKIILELKDRIGNINVSDSSHSRHEDLDIIEALESMGYGAKEAREALAEIGPDITETSARLAAALKRLGNHP